MSTTELERFEPKTEDARFSDDLDHLVAIIDKIAPGIGRRAMVAIAKEFASTYVYIPKPSHIFCNARTQWVLDQYDAGHRVQNIARKCELSESQVWKILGKVPGEDKQLALF